MNLGMPEMIFLVVIGLLLFGPKKLPEIGRQLGKFMAEFKRASNEFQAQLNDEVRKLELEEETKKIKEAVQPVGTAARDIQDKLNASLTDILTDPADERASESGAHG
jgi:sec-independent protein translocase protein TatB